MDVLTEVFAPQKTQREQPDTFFSPANNVRDLKSLLLSWKTCILGHLNASEKCSCHGLRVVATVFILTGSLFCYFSVVC